MAGRHASQAVTRYAGIQVQTSALGVQIPVGWGTHRSRCNLVDYLDFKSTPQKAAAAGKGGATTTGYNYSASIILAIEEGPIDHITQVWVNGKQYAFGSNGSGVPNTQNTAALAQVGLTLGFGAIGQAPWSYLLSTHADHAIGYSGLCIVYAENYPLDSSASTPNHSFEVVRQTGFAVGGGYTGPDVDPSLVMTDFFTNTRTGVPSWPTGALDAVSLTTAANSYQKYTLAAGLLPSPLIDQQRSATDFLNELLLATNATVVWSEGLLKFIPYGDTALTGNGVTYTPNLTPIYSLDDDDYIVKAAGDAPITIDIQDQSDAYNVVQLEYLDRSNQYNMAIALASDAANVAQYGMRRKDPDTVHCVCTPAVAAIAAQLSLQRTLYVRTQYKVKLGWMFALLEPGDLLELTDAGLGLAAYMVRITQIDEDDKDGTLDVTCEDLLVGVSNTPLYTMQNAAPTVVNQTVDPGGVEANLLLWSQDFTQSAWTKANLTITAAAAVDPLGIGGNAQKLLPTVTSGAHDVAQHVAVFGAANYTFSLYVQPAGYSQIAVLLNAGGGNEVSATANALTQAVTASASIGSAVLLSSSLTPVFPATAVLAGAASGTTCTLTMGATAGLAVGQQVYVSGATPAAYNGSVMLTGVTPTTITYTAASAPGGAMTVLGSVVGWSRLSMTFQMPSTVSLSFGLFILNNAGASSFAGDGVSAMLWYGAQLSQGVDTRPYAGTTTAALAPAIFNPPMALTPSGVEMWAAVAGGANWGGANVWVSYDGSTYEQVGVISGGARYGALSASFASGSDPDTTHTLSVDLSPSNGTLTSAAQAVADASGTLCLINDTAPELIAFETATLTAPNRYNLTGYLRRGVENTPIGTHSAGAPFIRLDQAIFDFPYLATQAGKSIFVKFQSFNLWGGAPTPLSNCIAYSVIPVPLGARPPSSSAWTATPTTITNAGVSTPVILITGKSDNPSASAVEFFYRPTGTSAWTSAGTTSNSATGFTIAPVQSGQTYDVAVAYVVNGVLGQLQIITGSGTTTGIRVAAAARRVRRFRTTRFPAPGPSPSRHPSPARTSTSC